MNEFYSTIILFIIGVIAGFINVNAGGGSSLTLPALIFLGLDSASANGTNRIAIFVQNIFAVKSFKNENYENFKLSLKLSLLTLPGSVAGAILAINIADQLFQKILGFVMIGIVVSLLIPKKYNSISETENDNIRWYVYPVMFLIGFYGGFIQMGVGFIIMASLHYLMKLNLILVNMHKVFIILIYTIPALIIFIFTNNVNWILGLTLAAGNSIGAWWGVKFSIKAGEKIIKLVLAIAILIMSAKLLNLF